LRDQLSAFLPSQCALKNPIDLTVEGTEEGYYKALMAVQQEYDAAVAVYVGTPSLQSGPIAAGVCRAAAETEKPVIASFMAGGTVTEALETFKLQGMPNYTTGERAVSVLAGMFDYEKVKTREPGFATYERAQEKLPVKGQMLEPDAMAWLAENDLPVPDFKFAGSSDQAITAARKIGYPVVMKVVSPDILHKSEFGGVLVNLSNDQAVAGAYEQIEAAATGKDFRGVVLYPMIKAAHEVILGLYRDPQFGPVVVFGMGGIYTEILGDIAMRPAPLNRTAAAEMINEIKMLPLLQGVRGQKAVNFDLLEETMVKFSMLPFKYPEVAELDLNPLFLTEKEILVGDVRVITSEQA
jgi:acetyltransferase